MRVSRLLILTLLTLALILTVPAQVAGGGPTYDVFTERGRAGISVYFVEARSGLSTIVRTDGTNHTLVPDGVIFLNAAGTVQRITPDGQMQGYPAIQAPGASVSWVVSADRRWLAWSLAEQEANGILSDLYTADLQGGAVSTLALHTSSTQGIGVLPLAISNDGRTLYYTRRPDVLNRPAVGAVEEVLRLNVARTETEALPNLVGVVTFSPDGRTVAWLADGTLRFRDLALNREDAVALPGNVREPGDLLLTVDGSAAIFAVVTTPRRFGLVLADRREPRLLINNLRQRLRPVAVDPAGRYALLVGIDQDGTYKLTLNDGTLTAVSDLTYLGQIP